MTTAIMEKMGVGAMQARRLVRTESCYVANQAEMESYKECDIEKYRFVATLDLRTSDICQELDSKVFEVTKQQPGVNCPPMHPNCRSTTIAEFDTDVMAGMQRRARNPITGKNELVPADMTYKEWYEKYVNGNSGLQEVKSKEHTEAYSDVMGSIKANNVEFNKVQPLTEQLTSEQIIERLAGGDMTKGSCSSLAFSYIGNKNGLNVLDFRGGNSRYVFSCNSTIQKMVKLDGVKGSVTKVQKEISGCMEIIKGLEYNKEYYLATGKHAAIIRNTEQGAEYLELQSKIANGWTSFENNRYGSMYNTLNKRFGCRKTVDKMKIGSQTMIFEKPVVIMEVDSFKDNDEFAEILGYINTATDKQKKGMTGDVK